MTGDSNCQKARGFFFLHVSAEKLTLYGQPMEMASELKYLGLRLDSRYTWEARITHLKTKCKKSC